MVNLDFGVPQGPVLKAFVVYSVFLSCHLLDIADKMTWIFMGIDHMQLYVTFKITNY